MIGEMRAAALLSVEEYLNASFHPDCDFIDRRMASLGYGMGHGNRWDHAHSRRAGGHASQRRAASLSSASLFKR